MNNFTRAFYAFWTVCDSRIPQQIPDIEQRNHVNFCLRRAFQTLEEKRASEPTSIPGLPFGGIQPGIKEACETFWREFASNPIDIDKLFLHECLILGIAEANRLLKRISV